MPNYSIYAALAGAGFIGPGHLEALRRLGIPVTGILGCNPEESESAHQAYDLHKAYQTALCPDSTFTCSTSVSLGDKNDPIRFEGS